MKKMGNRNSVPYGMNALYVYNETKGDLIKVLYAIHTVSGQPYHSSYISLDKIMETIAMDNWIVLPGNE